MIIPSKAVKLRISPITFDTPMKLDEKSKVLVPKSDSSPDEGKNCSEYSSGGDTLYQQVMGIIEKRY